MSARWDRFLKGFDRAETPRADERSDEVSIFEELDELHDQRAERGDSKWFPSDGDLAKLVLQRRERGRR